MIEIKKVESLRTNSLLSREPMSSFDVMSSDYESETWTDYTEPGSELDEATEQQQLHPLNNTEVLKLRKIHGLNKMKAEDRVSSWCIAISASCHPMNLILIILATACFFLEIYDCFAAVGLVVIIATLLRTFEMKNVALATVNMLRFATAKKVTTLRFDHDWKVITEEKISATELVPGDYIRLYPGDLIPADAEIIEGRNFQVLEYSFNGEYSSVRRYPNDTSIGATRERKGLRESIADLIPGLDKFFQNMHRVKHDPELGDVELTDLKEKKCFMGSGVVAGTALCRVISTGTNTHLGKMANKISSKNHAKPRGFMFLIYLAIGIVFFVEVLMIIPPAMTILLRRTNPDDWFSGLSFVLALGIAICPKYTPTMVSATLAKCSGKMRQSNYVMKDASTLMKLSDIDILCVGKTGILTMGDIFLKQTMNCDGFSSNDPLFLAYLNAHFQPVKTSPLDFHIEKIFEKMLANTEQDLSPVMPPRLSSLSFFPARSVDPKVVRHGCLPQAKFTEKLRLAAELPFDFVRRRVSVILKETRLESSDTVLICKGALQEVLEQCTTVMAMPGRNLATNSEMNVKDLFFEFFQSNVETQILTRDHKQELRRIADELTKEGLQVIGVAYKKNSREAKNKTLTTEDESALTFIGLLGFVDPPKYDARGPIKALYENNIQVKLISGDIPQSCLRLAGSLGIRADKAFTWQDFPIIGSPTGTLSRMLEESNVFAKQSPMQKAEIVKALQRKGHKVGFIGTSIADLPALAEAHLGISVFGGDSICTLSSDLIIPSSDLTHILNGIIAGRKTYGKIQKYLIATLSSSLGFIMSIMIASLWLPFYPMSTPQILLLTVICDTAQISILWDEVQEDFLKTPHNISLKSILKYAILLGFLICGFYVSIHIFMYFYFGISTPQDDVIQFQTATFVSTFMMQALMPRSCHLPFRTCFSGRSWMTMTLPLMTMGLILPFIPVVNEFLGMSPLPIQFYVYLIFALIIAKFLMNMIVNFK